MQFLGVDGCRAGWVVASWQENLVVEVYPSIASIMAAFSKPHALFIDMPIGLGERGRLRDVEVSARKLLKPYRASSIFDPPCREALYQPTIAEARKVNIEVVGKSLSAQSWNIASKIRELDQFLQDNPPFQPFCYEAHPEICFARLNQGQALKTKKAIREGKAQRLSLLKKYRPETEAVLANVLDATRRSDVKADDILDAICLALHAKKAHESGMECLVGTYPTDAKGLTMRICHASVFPVS